MFRVFWLSAKDLFDELFVLIGINLLWVLINLPLCGLTLLLLSGRAGLLALLTGMLAALPFGAANAGLYTIAQRATEGRAVSFRIFFEGVREFYILGWRVYLPWVTGLMLILVNLQFYLSMSNPPLFGSILLVMFIYMLIIWMGLLIYIGPLMLLQADKRIRAIARNAILLTIGRPMFTFVTLLMMGLILLLSIVLRIVPFIITFAFLALWGFRATMKLIKDAEARTGQQDQPARVEGGAGAEKGRGGQVRPRK